MRIAKNKTSFLSNIFLDVILSRDGTEISVRCPDCGKPGKSKMCIIIDSDVYHCWVCDLKGRGLTKLIKKVDPSKVSEYLSDYRSFKKSENKTEQEEFQINLPEDFRLLTDVNRSDPDWRAVAKYALSRGFDKKTMWSFRVGYSRSFQWRRRLIIPSFDKDGNVNYITGRSIDPDNSFRYKNESAPRKTIIFNEMDIDFSKPLLLAEGPMDLVKVNMNKTCLLGSTLGSDSLLFQRIVENQTPVILILDSDAKSKALKIADILHQYSVTVSINFPPSGTDLNDMDVHSIEQLIAAAQQYNYSTKIKLKLGSCKL